MKFINPYELLGLKTTNQQAIKKAKNRQMAMLELEGDLDYKGSKVSKADFIHAVDQLDESEKSEFYWFLKEEPLLNDFLARGDPAFFTGYEFRSFYQNKNFKDFVAPYFSKQFSKTFHKALQNKDIRTLRAMSVPLPLVPSESQDDCYRETYEFLKLKEQELTQLRDAIKNKTSKYNNRFNLQRLSQDLENKINPSTVNILPDYFKSLRSQIAQQMRNIAVVTFNAMDSVEEATKVLGLALSLKTDELTKRNIKKAKEEIETIAEERKITQKYGRKLEFYATKLVEIQKILEQIDSDNMALSTAKYKLRNFVNYPEINALPELFDEIRNHIAMGLRALSVAMWNKFNDLKFAMELANLASKVKVDDYEIRNLIAQAKRDLEAIRKKEEVEARKSLVQLTLMLKKIDMEATLHGAWSVNQYKLKAFLNEVFSTKHIAELSKSAHLAEMGNLVNELIRIIEIMEQSAGRAFAERIKLIAGNNLNIQNRVSNAPYRAGSRYISFPPVGTGRSSGGSSSSSSEGCYIATACYEDYNAPEVKVFRRFRDQFLLKRVWGIKFVQFYYKYSPYWADKLRESKGFNNFIRRYLLNPFYKYLNKRF